jgi:hypothetical protein
LKSDATGIHVLLDSRVTRCVCEKHTKSLAQLIFVKNNTILLQWKKGDKEIGLPCELKKLPKVNNHPMGENSTNLVTLLDSKDTFISSFCSLHPNSFIIVHACILFNAAVAI